MDVKGKPCKHQKTSVLWHALFRTYRDKIIVGGLLRLLADFCQLGGPIILQ